MLNTFSVRREELYSPSRSPSSSLDPGLDDLFRKSLRKTFAETAAPERTAVHVIEDDRKSEEVEFRLFANPSKANESKFTKIRVQSPSADDEPAGLVNPDRPKVYYFRDSLSPEASDRLKLAAVSGEDIIARSRTIWPGCALPWRVKTILSTGKPVFITSSDTVDQTELPRKKRRKGKKMRIAIRKKSAAERERLENEQKSAAHKELEERVKRAKRNRDKKLKKRERDKAKKAAARSAGEYVPDSSDDG
jgi:hypothetical protein